MASIQIKRAYDRPVPSDGKRILIDRLWPRELRKDAGFSRFLEQGNRADGLTKKMARSLCRPFHVIQATLPRRTEIEPRDGRDLAANGTWQNNIGICSA